MSESSSSSLSSSIVTPDSQTQQIQRKAMTDEEIELLQKLEEANRLIEDDLKSPVNAAVSTVNQTRSPELTHKPIRRDSISSDLSNLTVDSEVNSESEWIVWNRIVSKWSTYQKKKPTWIRDMIRNGVPLHFRPLVWQCLAKADESTIKHKYAEFMKMNSPCEKVIRRDISRTYPEHDFFKDRHGVGQERLFNVIKAYSLYDREVGYCQGIGFVVGLFLMNMPEEDAFAVLVFIMEEFNMRDMYKPDMFFLGLCIYQFECLVQDTLPDLYRHFQNEHVHTSMYASSWFLTLFSNQFPLIVVSRIMDLFLSEGIEIIFRVGIALLELHQDELMLLSMEEMMKYFQKDVPVKYENDPESLFQRAFLVQFNNKKMKKLEKEYQIIRKEEQEEQIEIRRLRNENRLLKQRVDNLEKESATLANRLIEGQVSNAQYAEESYQLKRENNSLRKQLEEFLTKSSGEIIQSNENELKMLRESVEKLNEIKEDSIMLRIQQAESTQLIGELRQKIAELEVHNQELITREQILDNKDLQERLHELQDEVMRLRLLQTPYRKSSVSTEPTRIDYEESDEDNSSN